MSLNLTALGIDPALGKIAVSIFQHLHLDDPGLLSMNQLKIRVFQDRLYVMASYGENILQYRLETGKLLNKQSIRSVFPGYRPMPPAPKSKPGQSPREEQKQTYRWLCSGHNLMRMDVHKGHLYGLFLLDMGKNGLWVQLDKKGFSWDNDKEQDKLVALSDNRVMTTKIRENDGDMQWTVQIGDQLPRKTK